MVLRYHAYDEFFCVAAGRMVPNRVFLAGRKLRALSLSENAVKTVALDA